MPFNSFAFLVLLSLTLGLYHLAPWVPRAAVLLTASLCFYAAWNPPFLALVLLTAFVDWIAGAVIVRAPTQGGRRTALLVSVVLNLAVLSVFKYGAFFERTFVGGDGGGVFAEIVLPAGISFYTFQSMSYTIDVYRRGVEAEQSFPRFLLFVLFFPQLVAGPIERAGALLGQLRDLRERVVPDGAVISGVGWILWGLVQKCVFADTIAAFVDGTFGQTDAFPGLWQLMATVGFGFQIYFDFCGYSDIARGTARLFGIELMRNFERPYLALNPSDFWKRWHISLSTWFRDYLYIPLGGDRCGLARTVANVVITMALAGLWHGANWTFVLWGLYHGALLALWRLLRPVGVRLSGGWPPSWRDGASRALCFGAVMLGWVPFRAVDLHQCGQVLRSMGSVFTAEGGSSGLVAVGACALALGLGYAGAQAAERGALVPVAPVPRLVLALAAIVVVIVAAPAAGPQFLYFQF